MSIAWKGQVDIGIITMRPDEFAAVLQHFPEKIATVPYERRRYRLRRLQLNTTQAYTIAVVRCIEQGNGEAQAAARDFLEDLAPSWLFIVGIAGGVPTSEFSLGDVIVSTRIADFSVEAVLNDHSREYALAGGPLHRDAAKVAADIPGMVLDGELDGWNSPTKITVPRPPVVIKDKLFYGPDDWKRNVREKIEHHFHKQAPRPPLVIPGPIASSDRLIKEAEILQVWLKISRHILAVEMESAGVYRALNGRDVPFLAIRGISDIVGFQRHADWTTYACHTAAAFLLAFLRTGVIPPRTTKSAERPSDMEKVKCVNPLPKSVDKNRFKDRDEQYNEIVTLLKANERLISIYGLGGVGKTTLICKVLEDMRSSKDCLYDMIFLSSTSTGINLDRIFSDFSKILDGDARDAVTSAWRNQQISITQKVVELLNQLHSRHYLLLLDGLEAIQNPDTYELTDLDVRTFIESVLEQDSTIHIVITSRLPLILSYALKSKDRAVSLDKGLPEKYAISLLHALDPNNEAGLHRASKALLQSLVANTEGFPLALVTIVGFLLTKRQLLKPDDLLNDKKLFADSITENIVQQLLARLNPSMICVMEGLAVFGQPIDRSALEYLLIPSHMDKNTLNTTLNQLVLAYFIEYNKLTRKFMLHPIVEEYCYNHITKGSPEDVIVETKSPYTRYALHYRAAKYYQSKCKQRSEWLSLDDLTSQFSEFDHRVRSGDYDTAARLIEEIDYDYLFRWGYFRRVLVLREKLTGNIKDKELEARNFGVMGEAYRYLGDFLSSINYSLQALSVDQEINNKRGQIRWILCLGAAYRNSGDEERSVEYFNQGLKIAQEVPDKLRECLFLTHLGFSHRTLGNYQQALEFYENALGIAQAIAHDPMQGCILISTGIAYMALGQYNQAESNILKGIKICQEGRPGDRRWEGVGLGTLGVIYTQRKQYDLAITHEQQAVAIAREIEDRFGEGFDLTRLGNTYLAQEHYDYAIDNLLIALEIAARINNREIQQEAGIALSQAYLRLEEYDKSLDSIETACQQNFILHNGETFALRGIILLRLGKEEQAHTSFSEALVHTKIVLDRTPLFYRAKYMRGLALAGLALLCIGKEQISLLAQSQEAYRDARDNCSLPGVIKDATRLLKELQVADKDGILGNVLNVLAGISS